MFCHLGKTHNSVATLSSATVFENNDISSSSIAMADPTAIDFTLPTASPYRGPDPTDVGVIPDYDGYLFAMRRTAAPFSFTNKRSNTAENYYDAFFGYALINHDTHRLL